MTTGLMTAGAGVALTVAANETHAPTASPSPTRLDMQTIRTNDGTQLYVTRGAGFWGPPLRVGASPDITVVALAAGP